MSIRQIRVYPCTAIHLGNEKQIFAPVPVGESAQMRPPWASTMARGEVKSQASAFGLLDGVGGAIEAVEDVRQVFGLDARALVADAHDHLLGAHLSADADLALRRVLERVRDEVGDALARCASRPPG